MIVARTHLTKREESEQKKNINRSPSLEEEQRHSQGTREQQEQSADLLGSIPSAVFSRTPKRK